VGEPDKKKLDDVVVQLGDVRLDLVQIVGVENHGGARGRDRLDRSAACCTREHDVYMYVPVCA
jgi:hypothetical protein